MSELLIDKRGRFSGDGCTGEGLTIEFSGKTNRLREIIGDLSCANRLGRIRSIHLAEGSKLDDLGFLDLLPDVKEINIEGEVSSMDGVQTVPKLDEVFIRRSRRAAALDPLLDNRVKWLCVENPRKNDFTVFSKFRGLKDLILDGVNQSQLSESVEMPVELERLRIIGGILGISNGLAL